MKLFFFFLLLTIYIIPHTALAQTTLPLFQEVPDEEEKKYLLGFVTKKQIAGDSTFAWYQQNLKYFKPQKAQIEVIKEKAYDFQLILFTGTWCHDSQQIIPKYFSLLEAAEFPDHRMLIIAVDRQKNAPANMQRQFNVVNVPTLIIMKDGKEVGRIEEFGATGLPESELVAIVKERI
jgi:thiol-disulfide isomerase/thioredoxin